MARMSDEGVLTIEDFMVHFGNVLNQNFGELRGMLVTQAVKLQKMENLVKQLKAKQNGEELEELSAASPEVFVMPEEQFAKGLKQENKKVPTTSTPKSKRNSDDAAEFDENDEVTTSPYGK
jgi:hypothetical protein